MYTAWLLDDEKENCVSGNSRHDYKYQAEQAIIDAFADNRWCSHGVIFAGSTPIEYRTRKEGSTKTDKIINLTSTSPESEAFFASGIEGQVLANMRANPARFGAMG